MTVSLVSGTIENMVADNFPQNFEACRPFLNLQSVYASFDK